VQLTKIEEDMETKGIEASELWKEYEEYLKKKLDNTRYAPLTIGCLDSIFDMDAKFDELDQNRYRWQQNCDQVARFTTIGTGILYAIARLMILVLLFTSLRSVPKGVYENTPWTRFLPNIS
jgi:hypothetical protein